MELDKTAKILSIVPRLQANENETRYFEIKGQISLIIADAIKAMRKVGADSGNIAATLQHEVDELLNDVN